MKASALIAAAALAVPTGALAQADATVTIACFGSNLALTAKSWTGDAIELGAEVLDLGNGQHLPSGRVVFAIDGAPVGPAEGVALRAGRDPRTGQPAGIALASFAVQGDLHLAAGRHTVSARFVPGEGSGLAPSTSGAADNLQIRETAVVSAPSTPAVSPLQGAAQAFDRALPIKAMPVQPRFGDDAGGRYWVEAENRLWRFSNAKSPALVVSGNDVAFNTLFSPITPVPTAPGFKGLLTITDMPLPLTAATASQVLFGGHVDGGWHDGPMLKGGYWLDPAHTSGIEAEAFWSGFNSRAFAAAGGYTAVPFYDPLTGPGGFVVAQPPLTTVTSVFINTTPAVFVHLFDTTTIDSASGSVAVSQTNNLWGLEASYRTRVPQSPAGVRLDVLAGLRYLNFSETLTINTVVSSSHNVTTVFDQSLGLPTGGIPVLNLTQTNSLTSDKFATRNDFVGPQLGARGEQHWDRIWASGEARLALGLMSEHVSISGSTASSSTTISTPTNSILLAGIPLSVAAGNTSVITTSSSIAGSGILSRPSTVGTHTLYVLAAVPSGSIKFGYDLVPNVASVWLGYDGMFISSVARAATQADSAGAVHQSSFWAQGADLGMKVRF